MSQDNALREALAAFVRISKSVQADLKSAHSQRGAGSSEWMRDDDRDLRCDFDAAWAAGKAPLAIPSAGAPDVVPGLVSALEGMLLEWNRVARITSPDTDNRVHAARAALDAAKGERT